MHLDLFMEKKFLFPYLYLDEAIEIDGRLDESYYIYFVLLGDKWRAERVHYADGKLDIMARNLANGALRPHCCFFEGADSLVDVKVEKTDSILKFMYIDRDPAYMHVTALPHLPVDYKTKPESFEVLYIGKSGTGKQTLGERLRHHKVLSKIAREITRDYSNKELFIMTSGVGSKFIGCDINPQHFYSIWNERVNGNSVRERHNEERGSQKRF